MRPLKKHLLRPERARRVPRSFSWIDHRLIRDGHLERLQPREILLYFFLVLVGDRDGLSHYSTRSISKYLKLPSQEIEVARASLCDRSLIAYREPLYQVLALPERSDLKEHTSASRARGGEALSIAEVIDRMPRKTFDG